MHFKKIKVGDLFEVHSGDYHAIKELDEGNVPLISCGDTDNGLVGFFAIPAEHTYQRAITVAYNGQPLTAKFHPYTFGTKDDVAVLVPLQPMKDTSLLYMAAVLNKNRWRYSYGRKCFQQKLRNLALSVPVVIQDGKICLDNAMIASLFPESYREFIPRKTIGGITHVPDLAWRLVNIQEIFTLARGDFHSIAALDEGKNMTVSRVSDDNGVVGYFSRPEDARVYPRGLVTVSTVGGDAFVQLDDFIATDNVIICKPKKPLRLTTHYFITFMLNRQKWRYNYGRQCYQEKLTKVNFYLPHKPDGGLDEDSIETIVKQASYWAHIKKRFGRYLISEGP